MRLLSAIFRFLSPNLHYRIRHFRDKSIESREQVRSILYAHLLHGRQFPPPPQALPVRRVKSGTNHITHYEDTLDHLRKLCPQSFEKWYKLLSINEETYTIEPEGSCSIDGHIEAELFGGFIKPYLRGYVLDVGCGPQDTPSYLRDYSPDFISGIDPLQPTGKHPFEFFRGFCEMLPWEDNTFHSVLIGTSFDHVFLPENCLREISRVLTNDGKLLVWISFTPNAAEYNPYDPKLQPIDKFHLFHFSKDSFYRLIKPFFSILEEICIHEGSTFFALTKKHQIRR